MTRLQWLLSKLNVTALVAPGGVYVCSTTFSPLTNLTTWKATFNLSVERGGVSAGARVSQSLIRGFGDQSVTQDCYAERKDSVKL